MKTAVVLTSLLAALALSAQAEPVIESVTVSGATNENGSNVTFVVAVTGFTGTAMVTFDVRSTNSLIGQQFRPEYITDVAGSNTWTNTLWNPYFTGEFAVNIYVSPTNDYTGAYHTTVTVARTIGGTMNSVQVPVDTNAAYNANMVFTNIDCINQVYLHTMGIYPTNGAVGIPCNLINVTNLTTPQLMSMSDEQMEVAFTDTARYRPAGTPFRFDMNLHKRPDSMMSFGDIKRFVWTPVSTTAPSGPGRLVLDVTSCSPWRNNYTTNLQAHVGFAPLYMTNATVAANMKGMIMCTSAHYMDVGPDVSDVGIGLKVNGHSNTTSYLKTFIPDTLLATWGISVDQATELLAGYVTHFTSNNISKGDTTLVTTEFTRITPGDIVVERPVYAYYSTNGDAGFETRLTFTFQSPVSAQIGPNPFVEGDFDGDRLADPYVVDVYGNWYIFFSGGHYQSSGAIALGQEGFPVVGDFDGDGLADPAMVDTHGNWYFWFSGNHYQPSGAVALGEVGLPAAADFDGDRKADPAIVNERGNWYFWFSGNHYQPSGAVALGQPGEPVAGDIDGDGLADPTIVDAHGNWYIWFSGNHYQPSGAVQLGRAGWEPVLGDFDGDGLADPVMVSNNNWVFCFSGGHYAPQGPIQLSP